MNYLDDFSAETERLCIHHKVRLHGLESLWALLTHGLKGISFSKIRLSLFNCACAKHLKYADLFYRYGVKFLE